MRSERAVDKVFQLVWFVVGALIFWRRSDERMALLVSLFLVLRAGHGRYHGCRSLVSSHPAWLLPVLSVGLVGNVCVVLFFLLFPGGRFAPRWTRWLAVAFTALVSLHLFPDCTQFARPGEDFILGVPGRW